MDAEPTDPIHVLGRMMNGMEFPEFRDFMIPTMRPVANEIEEDEGDDRLDVARNHLNEPEIADDEPQNPSEGEKADDDCKDDAEDIEERLRKRIGDIESPFGSSHLLPFVSREYLLHRDDQDEQDDDDEQGFELVVPQ